MSHEIQNHKTGSQRKDRRRKNARNYEKLHGAQERNV